MNHTQIPNNMVPRCRSPLKELDINELSVSSDTCQAFPLLPCSEKVAGTQQRGHIRWVHSLVVAGLPCFASFLQSILTSPMDTACVHVLQTCMA